MLTFLLFCVMGLVVALVAAAVVLPIVLVAGLLRLVFWPVRIVLRLIGMLVFAPLLGLLAVAGIGVALVVALTALALPLMPFLLLAGFGWAVYRVSVATPSPGA